MSKVTIQGPEIERMLATAADRIVALETQLKRIQERCDLRQGHSWKAPSEGHETSYCEYCELEWSDY